jgi:hypothetical protein
MYNAWLSVAWSPVNIAWDFLHDLLPWRWIFLGCTVGVVATHLAWASVLLRGESRTSQAAAPVSFAPSGKKHNRGRSVASWHLETNKVKGMKQEDFLRTQSSIEGALRSSQRAARVQMRALQKCLPSLCRVVTATQNPVLGSTSVRRIVQLSAG